MLFVNHSQQSSVTNGCPELLDQFSESFGRGLMTTDDDRAVAVMDDVIADAA